jgi:alkanesulfonate monooxygenase SsuD/methylene tetrahydromethanopterin reductase-like flavin-dependent oxidoreductase (luciferase family)
MGGRWPDRLGDETACKVRDLRNDHLNTSSRGRLYEGIDILRRCFEEEDSSYNGKSHQFEKIRMTTTPVHKRVPMWLGAQDNRSLQARGLHRAMGPPTEQEKV